MLTVSAQKGQKINWLEKNLPEGLLVDAAWLARHNFSTALRRKYVKGGRLQQPTRGVYRKPRGKLTWQQVIISLQTIILDDPIVVGGRTALELQGYAHYLQRSTRTVHLYSMKPPPTWLAKIKLDAQFVHHNSQRLFENEPLTYGPSSLQLDIGKNTGTSNDLLQRGLTFQPWGTWDWPLTLSTPERAILELLDELPDRETFHQADKLMEGLVNLNPRRLTRLLGDCRSVKVKRLFFFLADRHTHAWRRHLKKEDFDLGSGKRMLVKGGRLDPTYLITVPEMSDGV